MEQTNHQPRIVMFVMNDLLNDPRVQREARSAVRAGFLVTMVAMQSDRCRVPRETVDGYEVVRVRTPRFGILSAVFKLVGRASYVGRILEEGFKRVWQPFRGRPDRRLPASAPTDRVSGGFLTKVSRHLKELGFLKDMFSLTAAMLWAVRSEHADVFHGNDLPMLPLTRWAAQWAGGKAVYDSHELWVGMNPEMSKLFNSIARWIETRYIRRVDAVVTVNEPIADELRRRYKIAMPTIVMNCPDPLLPGKVNPQQSFRKQLNLSPGTLVVLYQGGYEPGRGLEPLIESARYLSHGVIVLRGYGALEQELQRRVAGQPEPKRVFMVDPVPIVDVVDAASEADIGVVPYTAYSPDHYYASPNKLFDYMMAGLAIAVSNLPVLEKIVRDHDLGVVFDPSDPRRIAEQLNALINNPARLQVCRKNAQNAARSRYHWDHEGGKLIGLYRTLAAGHDGSGAHYAS